MKPEVSIIIPTYNRSPFVLDTVLSAVRQTFSNCEVLVVDDGSDPVPLSEIETIFDHPEVKQKARLIRQKHLGVCAARNLGVRESAGEFFQFLDSDDLIHPKKIEIQKAVLDADRSLSMSYCLDEYFLEKPGDVGLLWNIPSNTLHLDRFLWKDPVWHTASPLWRRSALEDFDGWKDDLVIGYDDWEFHIRALCKGMKYVFVPVILHYLRDHNLARSFNYKATLQVEQSKNHAARLVWECLERFHLNSAIRSDALSGLMLFSADELFSIGSKEEAHSALSLGSKYASGALMRYLSRWMQFASRSSIGWSTLGRIVRRLLRKRLYEKRGNWKITKTKEQSWIKDPEEVASIFQPPVINNQQLPSVSVIVPTLKRFQGLQLILQDLCQQNVPVDEFEILVIDNGPDQETKDIVEKINLAQNRKIEYFTEPLRGLHYVRHSGARYARGQLLVYIDDDMRIGPNWLSSYLYEFRRQPFMVAAGGPIKPNWEKTPDSWIQELVGDSKFFPAFGVRDRGKEFLLSPDGHFFGGNMAISRKILFEVGGFNPDQFNELILGDGESGLHRKLWEHGFHIGYVPGAEALHWIPASKMSLTYLLHWAKNWGASTAYGEYSRKEFTISSLIDDIGKRFLWFLPYWFFVRLKHHKKLDPLSIHRQMTSTWLLEQIRYVIRLIHDVSFRRFVQHKDWLNNPEVALGSKIHPEAVRKF